MGIHETTEARDWLGALEGTIARCAIDAAIELFNTECYWRDFVSLSWNIKTVEGKSGVAALLSATLSHAAPRNLKIEGEAETENGCIAAWFTFETPVAWGKGHLRLKDGKGFTILTTMTGLKGHEERKGPSRDKGLVHDASRNRRTWSEERADENASLGISRNPYCVIIGGGQGGIALGARLKLLGVPTLIVEKNERAGDSWRNRYRSLVLHDPVWYDHLPYIPFPDHWPVFTPKDKMGDWLEMYVKVMELNYWSSAECKNARFDSAAKEWILQIQRQGGDLEVKCRQLVFATGSYGPPREVTIEGQEIFAGEQYHSSRHVSGALYRGKRCVVLGSNSSAHDICADLWEYGAEVTMIQRTPTTVVSSEAMMDVAFRGLYSEEAVARGIDVDTADLLFASVPYRLMPEAQKPLYAEIARRDAAIIARLNAVGFRTDYGEDESGLGMKAFRTGSGYYLDVGASELIANGAIDVRGGEIVRIKEHAIVLGDGSEIECDLIVYATGYLPMNEWVARIVSREAADLIGPNWGYGSGVKGDPGPWEGELRNMWKPLKQEAMWLHGGNLHLSRQFSKYLALQIKARMESIPTPVYW